MTESTQDPPPRGRPVRLVPTPPGFKRLVLGLFLAAFAPLFGFLTGSISGSPEPGLAMQPLYWGLFAGFVVGGAGVAVAVLGGLRLWSHHRSEGSESKGPETKDPAPVSQEPGTHEPEAAP